MLATCTEGNGCTFQISEADASDYDIADGNNTDYYQNLPENTLVVNAKINGKWEQYVETKMTRSQLDKFFGGDGFTMIYPFNPNFQPLDGEWKIQFGTVNGDVCYGQESNLFKKMLEGKMQSGTINFSKPFYARFLMNSPDVKWRKLQPNKYRGVLDFGFGNGPMKLVFDVELINPKEIKGMFTVTIKVPTKDDCVSKIPLTFICMKPNEWKDPWEDFEEPQPEDDLLPVNPKGKEDDLLPVNPKDDLLPVEPGKKPKPNVPRLEDPKPNIPRLEDDDLLPVKPKKDDLLPVEPGKKSKTNVPGIEEKPKTNVPRLEN